jgi:hypothetical protein
MGGGSGRSEVEVEVDLEAAPQEDDTRPVRRLLKRCAPGAPRLTTCSRQGTHWSGSRRASSASAPRRSSLYLSHADVSVQRNTNSAKKMRSHVEMAPFL